MKITIEGKSGEIVNLVKEIEGCRQIIEVKASQQSCEEDVRPFTANETI